MGPDRRPSVGVSERTRVGVPPMAEAVLSAAVGDVLVEGGACMASTVG